MERVSVDSNFFDDLGADSMVMARFCARVRKRPDLPSVSIKDIYQYPTIKSLATAVADAAPACRDAGFVLIRRSHANRDLRRPAETGGNTADRIVRDAAVVDLSGVFLFGRVGDRAGL